VASEDSWAHQAYFPGATANNQLNLTHWMTLGIQDVNQIQSQNQVYSRQRISAFPIEIREQDNMSIHSMDDRASIPEQTTPQPPEQQNTPQPQTLVLPQPLQPILQHQQQTIQATTPYYQAEKKKTKETDSSFCFN